MEDNQALKQFGEVLTGIYDLMTRVKVPVFGFEISLWTIFLFGAIGGFVVWFIHEVTS